VVCRCKPPSDACQSHIAAGRGIRSVTSNQPVRLILADEDRWFSKFHNIPGRLGKRLVLCPHSHQVADELCRWRLLGSPAWINSDELVAVCRLVDNEMGVRSELPHIRANSGEAVHMEASMAGVKGIVPGGSSQDQTPEVIPSKQNTHPCKHGRIPTS
jgi:hypothetical protein